MTEATYYAIIYLILIQFNIQLWGLIIKVSLDELSININWYLHNTASIFNK